MRIHSRSGRMRTRHDRLKHGAEIWPICRMRKHWPKYLQDLQAEFPSAILELFSIPGLGAKKIKALYEKLQISSIEQLLQACESGRVAELPGFGQTTQEKLCKAIAER